jgi:DNA-binding transcriptional ArsR family regulator
MHVMPDPADRSALVVASTQPEHMRRRNVSAVLRALLAHGPIARSEIARLTSLSGGTVTKLVSPLLASGLLREQAAPTAGGQLGRPRVPVDLDAQARAVVGLHIGLLRTTRRSTGWSRTRVGDGPCSA